MERKLPIDQVQVGMFVVELDRPWLDTPFMLQGFLIRDERVLAQLRAYCQHVVVDAARSTVPVALDHLSVPREDPRRPAATDIVLQNTGPTKVDASGRNRWLQQIMSAPQTPGAGDPPVPSAVTATRPPSPEASTDSLFDRLLGWFKRQDRPAVRGHTSSPDAAPAPASRLDRTPLALELTPATERFARASTVFSDVIKEIRTGKGLELEAVEAVVDDLVDSIVRNPEALQLVARLRESDQAAYGHALQVAVLMVSFGHEVGFSREELALLGRIGMLLDIGKMRVPPALLRKQGTLTPDEFEEVKRHVDLGLDMVKTSGKVHRKVLEGIHQHHERLDGSGYPCGLKDKQIGAFGRMAGIVDCFSAMTSPRPYADAMSPYEAMRQLQTWGERYFNAGLVQQFIQAIGIFPVGTLVELSTGESAVVIEQHKAHRLKPKVLVVGNSDGKPLDVPIILDLLYGAPPEGSAMPYIRRGLPADSASVDSSEYYLAKA